MTDLAAWILERIAEDEAAARAATPGPWRWDNEEFADAPVGTCQHTSQWINHGPDLVTVAEEPFAGGTVPVGVVISASGYDASSVNVKRADAAHIARHDPARVLAQCAALRAVVELHMPDHECTDGSNYYPGVFAGDPALGMTVCDTLRALAMIWRDHPDYRPEEWA